MKNKALLLTISLIAILIIAFKKDQDSNSYKNFYERGIHQLQESHTELITSVLKQDLNETGRKVIKDKIYETRLSLKAVDFWLRYLEPVAYKHINGPLPVEWETEVFEKFEKPYRRTGAGLTLAALYLEEEVVSKDSLLNLLRTSLPAIEACVNDSVVGNLKTFDHFFYSNRLFLLNLATIYTTGFECPDTEKIVPELNALLLSVGNIYLRYNQSFPNKPIKNDYFLLYEKTVQFIKSQSLNYDEFDHFTFIRDYVNPLFSLNQQMIKEYEASSNSYMDYSLSKNCNSIFSKSLYAGQNNKGAFLRVHEENKLKEIEEIGKQLFYDPILSGNNQRSCASCHKPENFFADTSLTTAPQFNKVGKLPRNTPSLINAEYNHLLMLDGKHFSLHNQAKDVITNPTEMGGNEEEVVKKVMSCATYKKSFERFLKYTPEEKSVNFNHITSAVVYYYSRFSKYYSPFDNAMNHRENVDEQVKRGFNLFMSKAQCATCHFVPQFNGVKPPYIGSEFEVLGVPTNTFYSKLSDDNGRHNINPAKETLKAFRTGTVRNAAQTAPYMHNGVFKTLEEVIEFYNTGGGAGHGLLSNNQTLSSDSLHLSKAEKKDLIAFINSLTETIPVDIKPTKLPLSKYKQLNKRVVGGEY